MKPNRVLLALLLPVSLYTLGCTEDVGDCDDPNMGQDTVLVGRQVQYGGQAIINVSCASCHGSTVTGKDRNGAPAGLDFDVRPVAEGAKGTDGTLTDTKGRTVVNLTDEVARGLRGRQRNIFEKRNSIWQQVKDGIMPPDDKFKGFRSLLGITDSAEVSPCVAAQNKYMDITTKPSQDILRNWLACNVPIVESTGADVGENGVPGKAGYQFISCTDTPASGDGGTPSTGDAGKGDAGGTVTPPAVVTIEQLDEPIFQGQFCSSCHPALNPSGVKLDLTSVDKAYATLVEDKTVKCNGKPYVTPGDVSKSWLYDVVSMDDPGCDTERMPQNLGTLSAAELKLVSDWISQGAKRDSDVKSISSALSGGLDAGVR